MSEVLDQLVALLQLERIEQNLFRGQSQDLGWGVVFGGQVLGQALSAASQTVPDERDVHSLHGYFLRPGDASAPIVYDVDCIRDGKSFTTRRVVAIQNGRAIFNMSASFQRREHGFEHQATMPDVPAPDELLSEQELARRHADKLPARMRARATAERPIERRPVRPINPLAPSPAPPIRRLWMRAASPLPDTLAPDLPEHAMHAAMLAYASDSNFLGTAMQPHAVSWLTPGMQFASLDHAMWFHRPFRFDQWLLYDIDSPSAAGARGLVRGQIFSRDGALIASTAQEALIRKWPQPDPS
jgi:acyl-CoA thioesterase-2